MNSWIERTISEFFEFTIPGDWGRPATAGRAIPVLRSTNFRNDGKIDFNDIAFRDVDASRLVKRTIKRGDVLIEKSGGSTDRPAGRVVCCDTDFGGTCSNFIELGRVNNGLDSKFVFYLLFHLYQRGLVLKYQQQTTGIINFKLDEYKQEKVHTPKSETEQSRIGDVLSCIDLAIERTEATIARQQRIRIGTMQDLLTKGIDDHRNLRSETTHEFKDSPLGRIPKGWEVLPIENKLERIIDYRGKTPQKSDSGIPLLTAKIIKLGYMLDPDEFISEEIYEQWMTRGFPRAGDVLFTTEAPLGNVAQIKDERVALGQRVLTLQTKPDLTNDFLFYLLLHPPIRLQFEILATGSTVTGIKQSQFRQIKILLPEIEEQIRIVSVLGAIDESIQAEEAKLSKLKPIKTGLMQNLLTGKVSVESLLAGPTAVTA